MSFHIDILQSVRRDQLSNGLRHGDFRRYRRFCSRRLKRVRKSVNFTTAKGRFSIGKKVLTVAAATDPRFLLIPLVAAERSWAFGMQLRDENNDDSANTRKQVVRKLTIGAKHAKMLVNLCVAKADERTISEAKAYSMFLEGTMNLEKRRYEKAHAALTAAKSMYTDIAKTGDAEMKGTVAMCLEELQPSIDYAAHCLKTKGVRDSATAVLEARMKEGASLARTLASLDASHTSAQNTAAAAALAATAPSAAAPSGEEFTIEWKGAKIAIKNTKVRVALLNARERESKLAAGKVTDVDAEIAIYDDILMHYAEAKSEVRDKRDSANAEADGVEDYVAFRIYSHTLDRNAHMVAQLWSRLESDEVDAASGSLKRKRAKQKEAAGEEDTGKADDDAGDNADEKRRVRPEEIARVYGDMIQTTHDMANALGDTDPSADPKSPLALKLAELRARRCVCLARSYLDNDQFSEALALVDRAASIARTAVTNGQAEKRDVSALNTLLSSFISTWRSVVIAKYNLHDAKLSRSLEDETSNLQLRETARRSKYPKLRARLPAFAAGTNTGDPALVDFPPAFQAVPFKPLYFDQAWDYLSYPVKALEKRVKGSAAAAETNVDKEGHEEREEIQQKANASSSGGGWFSSFWGSKK